MHTILAVDDSASMRQMVTFTLNGKTVVANPDQTILHAAQSQGIDIPRLCYMEGMRADGNCRTCMVEVKGEQGFNVFAVEVARVECDRHRAVLSLNARLGKREILAGPIPAFRLNESKEPDVTYRVIGLDPAPYRPLFGLADDELAKLGVVRMTVTDPTFPCRVSLTERDIGEIGVRHAEVDPHLDRGRVQARFPNLVAACAGFGIDMDIEVREPIDDLTVGLLVRSPKGVDLFGIDTVRRSVFAYSNPSFSDYYFGRRSPALAFPVLQSPIRPAPGKQATALERVVQDREHVPFAIFYRLLDDSGVGNDFPITSMKQLSQVMHGRQPDGRPWIDPTSGDTVRIPLAGDPILRRGWVDEERRGGGAGFLFACGPFPFAPGDTQEIVLGVGLILYPHLAPKPELSVVAATVMGLLFLGEGIAALSATRKGSTLALFISLCVFSYLLGIVGHPLVLSRIAQ